MDSVNVYLVLSDFAIISVIEFLNVLQTKYLVSQKEDVYAKKVLSKMLMDFVSETALKMNISIFEQDNVNAFKVLSLVQMHFAFLYLFVDRIKFILVMGDVHANQDSSEMQI